MDHIKIFSINSRGLNNIVKRKSIFRNLYKKKVDIVLVQETFCTKDKEQVWESNWGGKTLFVNGSNQSKGVALLLSNKISRNIRDVYRDIDRRYLIVSLELEGYMYCVANIYAPNHDDVEFSKRIFEIIQNLQCTFLIMGGDFNVVLNPKLDRNTDKCYHPNVNKLLQEKMESDNLIDIWRDLHETECKFSWSRWDKVKKTLSWSRIDYFLISQSLKNVVKDAEILPGIASDHLLIELTLHSVSQKEAQVLGNTMICC